MVSEGKFREDLFFRLNVIQIRMPPLRERRDDIPLLAQHFVREFSKENGKNVRGITPEVFQVFMHYSWPGNIRELRNVLNRMVVMARGEKLALKDVPSELLEIKHPSTQKESSFGEEPIFNLAEMEKRLIQKALVQTRQNISKAAVLLGISRRTLHRKLEEMEAPDSVQTAALDSSIPPKSN
jgi:DNA-binding NtrC family response regulator